MMRDFSTILATGGAGFIGSNLIRYLLGRPDFAGKIVNLDALTYAGNLESLADSEKQFGARYLFERADIRDPAAVRSVFERYRPDAVIHLAAESHVDRSIVEPRAFLETNILGTFNLLQAAREAWKERKDVLFHHVSTDEVYGSLGATGSFLETTPYDPRSPYSASKAGSDHLVLAYFHTYGLPVTLSNCSNNYGPYQFPEKLIPLMIINMLEGRPLPVYGDGRNVRDWLYVEDHASAIWRIMMSGSIGEKYNVGGRSEWENIRLLRELIGLVAERTGRDRAALEQLITFVKDRPGHDRRYSIDCSKITRTLGWSPSVPFAEGLRRTVDWYLQNPSWVEHVRSGAYREWISSELRIPGMKPDSRQVFLAYNTSWYVWNFRLPLDSGAPGPRVRRDRPGSPGRVHGTPSRSAGSAFQEIRLRARGKNPYRGAENASLSFLKCLPRIPSASCPALYNQTQPLWLPRGAHPSDSRGRQRHGTGRDL